MSEEFHPNAFLFPLMSGGELRRLADDIAEKGLLEPITLLDGKVIDGRNRLAACELADVEPRFNEWKPDGLTPLEWVVSKNLQRRHLTTAQRAALALDLLPHLEAEAKERQRLSPGRGGKGSPKTGDLIAEPGKAAEKAAELVGVGHSTVESAKAIQRRDQTGEVMDAMRTGEMNVSEATRAVHLKSSSGGVLDTGQHTKDGKAHGVFYGKGDKFKEAVVPAQRYFRGWRNRGFRFAHLNPAEARQRLRVLEELTADLEAARTDLSQRAEPAKMRV